MITRRPTHRPRRITRDGSVRRRAPGRGLRNGARWRRVRHRATRTRARMARRREPSAFELVHSVCLTVGHTGSGGSLVQSLLDAHPAMAFADGFDVLDQVAAGTDRFGLCHELARVAARQGRRADDAATRHRRRLERARRNVELRAERDEPGPRWRHRVPDDGDLTDEPRDESERAQWWVEGWPRVNCGRLEVLGECKAGLTTEQLGRAPQLLGHLERVAQPAEVVLLHLVRNPFDSIARLVSRRGRDLDQAVEEYFAGCEVLDSLGARLEAERVCVLRYDDLVMSPGDELRRVCSWLGVDIADDYLDAAAAVVRDTPDLERHQLEWPRPVKDSVTARIRIHPYLDGYSFETGSAAVMALTRNLPGRESA